MALLVAGFAHSAGAQTVSRGPYLQLGTPDSIVIKWRTDSPTDSVVHYGPATSSLTSVAQSATPTTEHEVTVSGLLPDTRYYYSIGTSSDVLAGGDADHTFVTAPPSGTAKPPRIWVVGDSSTKDANAAAVRTAYGNALAAIKALPLSRRSVPAMSVLESRLHALLANQTGDG